MPETRAPHSLPIAGHAIDRRVALLATDQPNFETMPGFAIVVTRIGPDADPWKM